MAPGIRMSDRDFMSMIEQQVLAGEPSVDPLLKRQPGTPEGVAALHCAEQIYVDGDPTKGLNVTVTSRTYL